jgi:glycosyltransferase involved in cell wall biosynthesis
MIEGPVSRADLHVHSKFSDRPSEWFLRRIGAPESFVEPADLYRICRARGMDFVTISDHNCIRGALEIADRPGTFLSAEITTYFPDDGCKIHCLVHGITEKDFAEIQQARENIHDLQRLLLDRGILHTIAHPLFRINDRLGPDHVEKLIVMFERFETLNGSRDPRAGDLARAVLENLTPDLVARMADRHGITPAGTAPWTRRMTGGSDDHGGLFIAEAHTVAPRSPTVLDFLQHLREGRHEPGGRAGNSLRLARSLYQIAGDYYQSRFMGGSDGGRSLIGALLARLAHGPATPPAPAAGVRGGLRRAVTGVVRRIHMRRLPPAERRLVDEVSALLDKPGDTPAADLPPERRSFLLTARLAQQLGHAFATRFVEKARGGQVIEAVASLGPVALGIAPYLTAFVTQHKDEAFLQAVADRFPGAAAHRRRSGRRAWLTDTFTDVNGVARTVRTLATLAAREGRDLTVVTCQPGSPAADFPLRNFEPVGTFGVPEYPQQAFAFPPFLEILAYLEEERFDEVILSTPGPLGLCGLAAARLFGLRCRGIYHTDFPDYVRLWTEDDRMKDLAWNYMRWFYGGMDRVYAPSRFYLEQLAAQGFERDRLAVMPRGIDLDRFGPHRRNPGFWGPYGLNGGFKFLYVGRIAREKNLDVLGDAFLEIAREDASANLVFVGDGPEFDAMKKRYAAHPRIAFTGVLHGDRLAEAYASADVFVFPSLTDTFGNAVLEAHASGLPAIVADRGGPPEIVATHGSGLVVDGASRRAWADAMRSVRTPGSTLARLREGALARARDSRWETALAMLD